MKIRVFSILVILMAVLCLVACDEAPKEPEASEGLAYRIESDGTCTVTGIGTCEDYDIVIPSKIEGHTVTTIDFYAFRACTGITSVYIPDTVISIGKEAFCECVRLTSITVPDSVKEIGKSAFEACDNLESISLPFVGNKVDGTSNTHFGYIFGASVWSENDNYIPTSLKTVMITGGTNISSNAFYNCTELTFITIPSSITNIGESAFADCKKLNEIILPFVGGTLDGTTNTHFGYIFGAKESEFIYGKTEQAAYIPASLQTVVITGGSSIDEYAFSNCAGLTSITIPNSVTRIGSSAFYRCDGLTKVHISDLKTWCEISFNGSYSNPLSYAHNLYLNGTLITDLVIPNNVSIISEHAFYDCTSLTSVTISSGVTSIGSLAFCGCTGLTSVTIPNSVTDIGSSAFTGCTGLTSVAIPNSVTSVDALTFRGCTGLNTLNIPDSVTSIGSSAFSGCTGLTSVTIPNSVTDIGSSAFFGCKGLTTVHIPKNVTNIGPGAFSYCTGLTSITVADENATYHSANNCVINTASKTLIIGCKNSVIPTDKSVTNIGESAFSYCTEITSIAIPNNINRIQASAFEYCTRLTSIVIPEKVYMIGESAFAYCTSLTTATISDGVSIIEKNAFRGCSKLTAIYCEATSKPSGWNGMWNYDCPAKVVWGRKE